MTTLKSINNHKDLSVPVFPGILNDLLDFGNITKEIRTYSPAINISESKTEYTLEFSIPGYKKEDIYLEIEEDTLHVSCELKREEKSDSDRHYSRREFSKGSFKRSFTLPDDVDQENIKAIYESGILIITLFRKAGPDAVNKKTITIS